MTLLRRKKQQQMSRSSAKSSIKKASALDTTITTSSSSNVSHKDDTNSMTFDDSHYSSSSGSGSNNHDDDIKNKVIAESLANCANTTESSGSNYHTVQIQIHNLSGLQNAAAADMKTVVAVVGQTEEPQKKPITRKRSFMKKMTTRSSKQEVPALIHHTNVLLGTSNVSSDLLSVPTTNDNQDTSDSASSSISPKKYISVWNDSANDSKTLTFTLPKQQQTHEVEDWKRFDLYVGCDDALIGKTHLPLYETIHHILSQKINATTTTLDLPVLSTTNKSSAANRAMVFNPFRSTSTKPNTASNTTSINENSSTIRIQVSLVHPSTITTIQSMKEVATTTDQITPVPSLSPSSRSSHTADGEVVARSADQQLHDSAQRTRGGGSNRRVITIVPTLISPSLLNVEPLAIERVLSGSDEDDENTANTIGPNSKISAQFSTSRAATTSVHQSCSRSVRHEHDPQPRPGTVQEPRRRRPSTSSTFWSKQQPKTSNTPSINDPAAQSFKINGGDGADSINDKIVQDVATKDFLSNVRVVDATNTIVGDSGDSSTHRKGATTGNTNGGDDISISGTTTNPKLQVWDACIERVLSNDEYSQQQVQQQPMKTDIAIVSSSAVNAAATQPLSIKSNFTNATTSIATNTDVQEGEESRQISGTASTNSSRGSSKHSNNTWGGLSSPFFWSNHSNDATSSTSLRRNKRQTQEQRRIAGIRKSKNASSSISATSGRRSRINKSSTTTRSHDGSALPDTNVSSHVNKTAGTNPTTPTETTIHTEPSKEISTSKCAVSTTPSKTKESNSSAGLLTPSTMDSTRESIPEDVSSTWTPTTRQHLSSPVDKMIANMQGVEAARARTGSIRKVDRIYSAGLEDDVLTTSNERGNSHKRGSLKSGSKTNATGAHPVSRTLSERQRSAGFLLPRYADGRNVVDLDDTPPASVAPSVASSAAKMPLFGLSKDFNERKCKDERDEDETATNAETATNTANTRTTGGGSTTIKSAATSFRDELTDLLMDGICRPRSCRGEDYAEDETLADDDVSDAKNWTRSQSAAGKSTTVERDLVSRLGAMVLNQFGEGLDDLDSLKSAEETLQSAEGDATTMTGVVTTESNDNALSIAPTSDGENEEGTEIDMEEARRALAFKNSRTASTRRVRTGHRSFNSNAGKSDISIGAISSVNFDGSEIIPRADRIVLPEDNEKKSDSSCYDESFLRRLPSSHNPKASYGQSNDPSPRDVMGLTMSDVGNNNNSKSYAQSFVDMFTSAVTPVEPSAPAVATNKSAVNKIITSLDKPEPPQIPSVLHHDYDDMASVGDLTATTHEMRVDIEEFKRKIGIAAQRQQKQSDVGGQDGDSLDVNSDLLDDYFCEYESRFQSK